MQTILGANGPIANLLAVELKKYSNKIRLVSRHCKKINEDDEVVQTDLTDKNSMDLAIKDSDIVYVTIGFQYNIKIWQKTWPEFIKNLILSCNKYSSKIVFLDNMYMLDKNLLSNMTEDTPINPCSKKGEVRAQLNKMLLAAIEKNEVHAIIARAADFYGPGISSSMFTYSVLNKLLKDKNPQLIGNPNALHSFSYTEDIAKALALLGNTPDAFNQIWHLPTWQGKLTLKEYVEIFMNEINVHKNIKVLPVSALTFLGIFIPILKEIKDISYQFTDDYFFNSSKFNEAFKFTPITPPDAIKKIVNFSKNS